MYSEDDQEHFSAWNKETNQQKNSKQHTDIEGNSAEDVTSEQVLKDETFPEGGTRAWLVALGAAGVLFCTFGYVNAFGVFQEYYQTHQLSNQSASAISWIGSIQVFFLFAGALFGGPLFDRFGAKVIWPSATIFIFSIMMTSLCTLYYQFMLAQGILGGFTMGMTMAPAMASTAQYFHKNRGAALGVAVAGSSLGGVIFPIALSHMLYQPRLGFEWTVRVCGFIMLPLLAFACVGIRARLPPRKGKFFLPSAFKEPRYVFIIVAVFFMMLGIFTPFFYLPTYAVYHGMDTQLASYLISILNGTSLLGRLIPGILADKAGPLNMLCGAAICSGVLILCWQAITTSAAIIAFSALYGFFSGAIVSLMSVSLAHVPKDPRDIGTYLGMGMAVVSLAALAGPPISGAFVSSGGGFDHAAIFSGVVVLTGGFIVLAAKHVSAEGIFGKI